MNEYQRILHYIIYIWVTPTSGYIELKQSIEQNLSEGVWEQVYCTESGKLKANGQLKCCGLIIDFFHDVKGGCNTFVPFLYDL